MIYMSLIDGPNTWAIRARIYTPTCNICLDDLIVIMVPL